MFAVLSRAILDTKEKDRIVCRAAWKWFHSDETEPWTFVWCCEELDIETDRVRGLVDSGKFKLSEISPKNIILMFRSQILEESEIYKMPAAKTPKKPI